MAGADFCAQRQAQSAEKERKNRPPNQAARIGAASVDFDVHFRFGSGACFGAGSSQKSRSGPGRIDGSFLGSWR